MNLPGKIVVSNLASVAGMLGGLAKNKILALLLSLDLFGIFAIGQQSVSLIVSILSFGLPTAAASLLASVAGAERDALRRTFSKILVTVAAVGAGVAVLTGLAVAVDLQSLAVAVTASAVYAGPVGVMLLAAPLMIVHLTLASALEGLGRVRQAAWLKVIPLAVAVPALALLATRFSLPGAAAAFLLGEGAALIVALWMVRDLVRLDRSAFSPGDVLRPLLRVALYSLGVAAATFAVDFVVKRYVLHLLGESANGIVQSVGKLTDLYPSVSLAWLTVHLFPVLGALGGDRRPAGPAIERTLHIAVSLVFPLILMLFLFRGPVLAAVYSGEFTVGRTYFGAWLAAGIPLIYSWVLGVATLPVGLTREWFFGALVYGAAYGILAWLGLNATGSILVLAAAAGTARILHIAYMALAWRRAGVPFSPSLGRVTLLYAGVTVSLALALSSEWWLVAAAGFFTAAARSSGLLTEARERLRASRRKVRL